MCAARLVRWWIQLLLLGGVAAACSSSGDGGSARGGPAAPGSGAGGTAAAEAWVAGAAAVPEALRAAVGVREGDEVVLDARADGTALVGRVDPAPPLADPVRTLRVRWISGGRERPWSQAGLPLADARLLPDGGALVLGADGRLVVVTSPDAPAQVLDRAVVAPLSVTPDGRFAAYARGEMPSFQIVRLDVAQGATRVLAPDLAPAWCPAISADGEAVVFATSAGGRPELYRVETPSGSPRRWPGARGDPGRPLLPTGPSAPVLTGDLLVFEDGDGLVAMRADGSLLAAIAGAHAPVYVPTAGLLLAHATPQGGAARWIPLGELGKGR